MSTGTRPDRAEGGAARFQPPTIARPRRSPFQALGAALVLLLLLVGVPAGLFALHGVPTLPSSWSGTDLLTQQVGVEQLLTLLVVVVWLAWLQFVWCVVAEVGAVVRGGVLARPVPLAGPSQRLARSLVGAVLLTGTLAGQAAAVPALTQDAGLLAQPVAAVQVVDAQPDVVPVSAVDEAARGSLVEATRSAPAAASGLPADVAELVGQRVYTVQAQQGRHHDNLWDIAERELGDGRRYQEIYDLNAGRVQPDGRTLELARLVHPGWRLIMPADAVGVERFEAPPAEELVTPSTPDEVLYTVQPPDGRTHDTLWDIADRELGDPLRYREIFDLNVDREQADGQRLTDPDLIHPGWVLRLPGDAVGGQPAGPAEAGSVASTEGSAAEVTPGPSASTEGPAVAVTPETAAGGAGAPAVSGTEQAAGVGAGGMAAWGPPTTPPQPGQEPGPRAGLGLDAAAGDVEAPDPSTVPSGVSDPSAPREGLGLDAAAGDVEAPARSVLPDGPERPVSPGDLGVDALGDHAGSAVGDDVAPGDGATVAGTGTDGGAAGPAADAPVVEATDGAPGRAGAAAVGAPGAAGDGPSAPGAGSGAEVSDVAAAAGEAAVEAAVRYGGPLLVGGLLAAGLLGAVARRRGPYGAAAGHDVEDPLRLSADTETAALLDRALRQLSAARIAQGLPLPEAVLVAANPMQVVLHATGTADSPSLQDPPAPWSVADDGRTWTVAAPDVAVTAPDVPAPYPALVNVASTEGVEVLVDLEAAGGVVSLTGDEGQARDVAFSMAVELATNQWSDGVDVTLVGFGEPLAPVAPGAVAEVGSLAEVLDGVEARWGEHRDLLTALGVDGLLSGRARRTADRVRPQVLVLAAPPQPAEAARLQGLVGAARSPVAVVCVGDVPTARWRFDVRDDAIDLGVLGVTGTARRFGERERRLAGALVAQVSAAREARARQVSATPSEVLTTFERDAVHPGVASGSLTRRGGGEEVGVRVRLLGPVTVEAPGPVDPAQRPLLTELVVAVALAPEGLHQAVLQASIWPRGVSEDVVRATTEAAMGWLGVTAAGAPRLRLDQGGRWRLADDVRCDWDDLRRAAAAQDDPVALTEALAGSGPVFSNTPVGRYHWFAFAKSAEQARVLATSVALRAADLWGQRGRPDAAEGALRLGLVLVPTAEPLWRDMLRLVGPQGAPAVVEELGAVLRREGLRAEPETDALIHQLVPARQVGAG